jgi:GAF domain-containing protein
MGCGWVLEDLGSKNGTSVNGLKAAGQPLADGDWISVGGVLGRFELLSSEAAQAIDAQRLSRLQTSLEMKRQLGADLEPLDLLLRLLESAMEVASAERGFVLVYGSDGRLHPEVASGFMPGEVEASGFTGSLGAVRRALESGTAVVLSDIGADPILGRRPSVVMQSLATLACVPLRHESRIVGLLYVDSRRRTAFSELDVEILAGLADHTALMLAGAQIDRSLRALLHAGSQDDALLTEIQHRLAESLAPAAAKRAH